MSVKSQIRRRQFKNSIPSQLRFISIALIAVLLYYVYSLRKQLNKKEPETTTGEIETCADCPKCDSCCPDCPDCPDCPVPPQINTDAMISYYVFFALTVLAGITLVVLNFSKEEQWCKDIVEGFTDEQKAITRRGFLGLVLLICIFVGYFFSMCFYANNSRRTNQAATSTTFVVLNVLYTIIFLVTSIVTIALLN